MGRFGNVGSVALQDLAKVPPGHSSLLCQLSLICALHFYTELVRCTITLNLCNAVLPTLNTCTALVHYICALALCTEFVHCSYLLKFPQIDVNILNSMSSFELLQHGITNI